MDVWIRRSKANAERLVTCLRELRELWASAAGANQCRHVLISAGAAVEFGIEIALVIRRQR